VCPDPGIDAGRPIDWGRVANDYARYRPGPPDSFYEQLRAVDPQLHSFFNTNTPEEWAEAMRLLAGP
jgi:hypothetical protein